MSRIFVSMDVEVPVAVAFETLTSFEDLPRALAGEVTVQQIGDRTLYWIAQVLGMEVSWLIELTDIDEERLISWATRSGPRVHGTIWLDPIGYAGTRMSVVLHYDPASFTQGMLDHLGLMRRWLDRSLTRLKLVMEDEYDAREHLPLADELVGH